MAWRSSWMAMTSVPLMLFSMAFFICVTSMWLHPFMNRERNPRNGSKRFFILIFTAWRLYRMILASVSSMLCITAFSIGMKPMWWSSFTSRERTSKREGTLPGTFIDSSVPSLCWAGHNSGWVNISAVCAWWARRDWAMTYDSSLCQLRMMFFELYFIQASDWIKLIVKSICFSVDEKIENMLHQMRQLTIDCIVWQIILQKTIIKRRSLYEIELFTHALNKWRHLGVAEFLFIYGIVYQNRLLAGVN